MKKLLTFLLIILISSQLFSQEEKIGIIGVIDWESMQIKTTATLDLISAGLRLPAGRNRAESIIEEGYKRLVRSVILELQVDSSSAIADLIEKNEFSLPEVDAISLQTQAVPPFLSPDMRNLSASYSIPITAVSNTLQTHSRPYPVSRTLNPVSSASYTGIIIIAAERLPAHGMRSSFLPVPCLFPKIWDSEMNLIYDRSMVQPRTPAVRYSSPQNIFFNTPSGLSPELQEIVGERPFRIFAQGVFGTKPTDLIINRNDALQIISNEQNRSLLTQGKVVIILDQSVLTQQFSY